MATDDVGLRSGVADCRAMRMSRRIAGLDGLRAMCVVLVFVEHFVMPGHGLGGLGVKIFFALSGFLIVGILHGQRRSIESGCSTSTAELQRFWLSRVLRIFPIYYLVLIALATYGLIKGVRPTFEGLHYYFGFLGNYYIQHISHSWGKFTHLWSISVEQHFYMLASPVLLWLPLRRHILILLALLIASISWAAFDFAHWDSQPRPYLSDVPNFAFMAAGGLLALARAKGASPSAPWMLAVFVASVAVLQAINFNFLDVGTGSLRITLIYGSSLVLSVAVLAYIPEAQASAVVRFLELQPMRYLGMISYGFYVYHYLLPHLSNYAGRLSFLPYPEAVLVVVQFVATCGIAAASWHFIEQPLLRLKGRFGSQTSTRGSAAAEAFAPSGQAR
jgi:peptidoglycan/LPS O-acetylase OafA/YrhL